MSDLVLSRQNFLTSRNKSVRKANKPFMTTLNQRKIRLIMKELEKGEMSIGQIADMRGVTSRRVRQLREYKDRTGNVFQLKTERAVCHKGITIDEILTVSEAKEKYKVGSTILERIIDN